MPHRTADRKTLESRLERAKKGTLRKKAAKKPASKVEEKVTVQATHKVEEVPVKVDVTDTKSETSADSLASTPPRRELVNAKKAAMQQQNGDVNWVAIVGYNEREAAAEEKLYARLERESQKEFQQSLESQIAVRNEQRQREKQEVEEYRAELRKGYEKVAKEDADKAQVQRKKAVELKKIRDAQISEVQRRRVREERKLRRFELREVRLLEAELAEERAKADRKKAAEKSKLEVMLADNERQKQIKAAEKRAEEEQAVRLQKEYAAMLEKQEKAREQRLKDTYAKQQHRTQALVNATADIAAQARADAERAERELKERQRLEDEKTRLKDAARLKLQKECQAEIAHQIQARKQRMLDEIAEDRAYGEKMKKENEDWKAKQADLARQKDEKLRLQAQFLEEQIRLVHKRKAEEKTEMNSTEKLLNSQLLQTVQKGDLNVNKPAYDPKKPFNWRYVYRRAPF